MFRLRSKSGDESVFRTADEIRAALLSGFVTPDAQIWDAELKGWVPLLEHGLYKEIAAVPPARKTGPSKAIPTPPKPAPKLVIKRPGDAATTAIPAVKPPVPPAPAPAPPADEVPELELIDLELPPEPIAPPPVATAPVPPPVAPEPPPAAPPVPPKRPTPPPAPVAAEPPVPRESAPERPSTPVFRSHVAEVEEASRGGKLGLLIGAVVVIGAAAGGVFWLRGRGGSETPPADSTPPAVIASVPADSMAADSSAALGTPTTGDTLPRAAASTDSAPSSATPASSAATTASTAAPAADTASATGSERTVPFAPLVGRGLVPWTAPALGGIPLATPALEAVRQSYAAATKRALDQFEAGLEAAGFQDMFDPGRVGNAGRRDESFDAIDQARSALRDYRRRLTAIDFAYTDSLRRAAGPSAESPDLRTFGPLQRESPAQAALTDSLVSAVSEMYGMLVSEAGGYTFRAGTLAWRDADNLGRYRTLQERLTAQIARLRNRPPGDFPPATAAILRGIGLPR